MSLQPFLILHSRCVLLSFVCCIGLHSCETNHADNLHDVNIPIVKTPEMKIENMVHFLTTTFDSASSKTLVIAGDTCRHIEELKRSYALHKFLPFWMNEEGITQNVSDYIMVLNNIRYDGLNAEDYQLNKIEASLNDIKQNKTAAATINDFELLVTQSFLKLSNDMMLGNDTSSLHKKDWKNKNDSLVDVATILCKTIEHNDVVQAVNLMRPKHRYYKAFLKEYKRLDELKINGGLAQINISTDSIAFDATDKNIPPLRKRLRNDIGIPTDTSSLLWTQDLVNAVKKFQHLNYCKETGKIDSITLRKLNVSIDTKLACLALNMNRLRKMKHDFPQPYIWVDVPKMELDYVEHDSIQFNMRVVVGKPARPTTMLDAQLENIVFSPPWTVPPTIMKEDVLPGIARRGGSYLARKGLKAYDRRGRVVSASAITSKNYRNFSIGQAPGYRSSLGEVKFNLPNPWSIYLHDTPHREDFVKFYRAFSSGCIRVHHPKEFAAFLLRDSLDYSYAKIDSICKKRRTIFVPIKRTVAVHIVYLTNALDSAGNVMYLKDIYKWD